MTKSIAFQGIFEKAKKSQTYWEERAVLDFTEELVERMDAEGVSRAELARRIKCSPAYVTKILRGTTNFTLDSMVRVALALGCELRTHLQPQGTHCQWFDLLEGARGNEGAFRNSCEMKETLHRYKTCGGKPIQEDTDDRVALAS